MDTEQSEKIRRYMVLKVMEKRNNDELNDLKPVVLDAMMAYNGVDAKVEGD
jgi:hypothetical protein